MSTKIDQILKLFPLGARVNALHHLQIADCDCIDIARKYGTPLYVFDEYTIRYQCREFIKEFTIRYENTQILYASKAFINKAVASIIKDEGLGLDVVSGGEISVASSAKLPGTKIYFHGNNKTLPELEQALHYGIGRIVVDNFWELEQLNALAGAQRAKQDILLRLSPGIDAHTHQFTTTGILDSKFGFPIATGQAEEAVKKAMQLPNLNLKGLHCHLGSPIFKVSPYELAISSMMQFAKDMWAKYGFVMQEFSPGGGYAVPYNLKQAAPAVDYYAEHITRALLDGIQTHAIKAPRLIIEPGRSLIARAGFAMYTVGSGKHIPGVRDYIFIDGGMGDNIRPALYQAEYTAVVANNMTDGRGETVTIAGKYCESGDIIIRDADINAMEAGDIIAIPVCGAYSIPMSSNYNLVPRPAIVMLNNGRSRIIRKRETYQDLQRLDRI
jgi:diaminopimelate decarboxylase